MIDALRAMVSYYCYDYDLINPVMITLTTKFPPSLRGKFLTLRYLKQFIFDMKTRLPYREYHFKPIISSLEYSENAVHVHLIADDVQNVNILQRLWTSLNRHDLGTVYANHLVNVESGFDYVMKDYTNEDKPVDKFFGLYVTLSPEGIYTFD